jgi:type IV pilus assembly protein PilY1
VQQSLTTDVCPPKNRFCVEGQRIVKVASPVAVDFTSDNGWYFDFPVTGERVNTDLRLVLGTLSFNTNTPKAGVCDPVAESYNYFINYQTGAAVTTTEGIVGAKLGDFLATMPAIIKSTDPDNPYKAMTKGDCTGAGCLQTGELPIEPSALAPRRISWRELVN